MTSSTTPVCCCRLADSGTGLLLGSSHGASFLLIRTLRLPEFAIRYTAGMRVALDMTSADGRARYAEAVTSGIVAYLQRGATG